MHDETLLDDFKEDEVDEALAYAQEAFIAASSLNTALEDYVDSASAQKLLSVAVEQYVTRFKIPTAALEENSEDTRSKAAKVVAYLYASAKRVFQYFFDYLRNQKLAARRIIPRTKDLIGRVDAFSSSVTKTKITDRGVILGLHINGIAPIKPTMIFESVAEHLKTLNNTTGITEMAKVLSAAKSGNEEAYKTASTELHSVLSKGIKDIMAKQSNPKAHPAFKQAVGGRDYYASEVFFGQQYLTASISDVDDKGYFQYGAGIVRDAEVPVRAESFASLSPDEVRTVCRTSLRLCEQIIEYSRDEDLVQKLLREASFFVTKEGGVLAVPALRNFTAVANNHYFAYLRFIVKAMQHLMRWATLSVQAYEQEQQRTAV